MRKWVCEFLKKGFQFNFCFVLISETLFEEIAKLGFGAVLKLHWQVFGFFDHLPSSVDIFYLMNVGKKSTFWTTYPPPLVKLVCERPFAVSSGLFLLCNYFRYTGALFLTFSSSIILLISPFLSILKANTKKRQIDQRTTHKLCVNCVFGVRLRKCIPMHYNV